MKARMLFGLVFGFGLLAWLAVNLWIIVMYWQAVTARRQNSREV